MKIAIIGTGNVGSALGRSWENKSHEIIFGVRDPNAMKVQTMLGTLKVKGRAVSVKEAAQAGDVVVLAVPWDSAQDAIRNCGNLQGKTLIDCTNPLRKDLQGLQLGNTTSGGEMVAQWARGAKVVKAFNTTGAQNMENPNYGADKITMFICGDDQKAKETVVQLVNDLGLEPLDVGPLYVARWLEPLAMLWIHTAFVQKMGVNFAFKMIQRKV